MKRPCKAMLMTETRYWDAPWETAQYVLLGTYQSQRRRNRRVPSSDSRPFYVRQTFGRDDLIPDIAMEVVEPIKSRWWWWSTSTRPRPNWGHDLPSSFFVPIPIIKPVRFSRNQINPGYALVHLSDKCITSNDSGNSQEWVTKLVKFYDCEQWLRFQFCTCSLSRAR